MGMINRVVDEVNGRVPAKQEFAKEANINYLMKRAIASGQMPDHTSKLQPIFADVSGIGDYADSLRRIDAARDSFELLSAEVRSRFRNRPDNLIAFLNDPANLDEAVKLGLVAAPAAAVAAPAAVVPVAPVAPAVS